MKLFKSIKWQLLIWQTVLLAGVLVTLMTLHYQFQKRDLIAAVDAGLQDALLSVMPIIAPPQQAGSNRVPGSRPLPPDQPGQREGGPAQIAAKVLDELGRHDIYLVSRGFDGHKQHGRVPASLLKTIPEIPEEPVRITREGNRELIHPHHDTLIVIGRPLTAVNAKMAARLGRLILIGAAVLLVGFGIGWLIISRALRPVCVISRAAETIAGGNHDQRIELSDAPEELASLAQTLNSSFDHLNKAIKTRKRFSADASHELRTPIAVVIAQAETALKRDRSAGEYQNALQACLRAGRRMKSMADSLLELTRLDEADAAPAKIRCDLNEVIADTVDSASLLSEKHPLVFQCLEKPLFTEIDPNRIHQALMNLISNSMQHNPQGCDISVRLKDDGLIEVADNGIGIPEEHLPHIFDRFYRVDKSRSRGQGGAGLGLSIARSLIEAHGGTIEVSSAPGSGTTFAIRLPPA